MHSAIGIVLSQYLIQAGIQFAAPRISVQFQIDIKSEQNESILPSFAIANITSHYQL